MSPARIVTLLLAALATAQRPPTPVPDALADAKPTTREALAELLPKLEGVVVTSRRQGSTTIADPTQLVRWMEAVRTSCAIDANVTPAMVTAADVDLLLYGKRFVRLSVRMPAGRLAGQVDCLGVPSFGMSPELERLVRAACMECEHRGRLAGGTAVDAEELRRIPATTRTLHCVGARAEDVCAQLPRLQQLEAFGYSRGLEPAWQLRSGLPRILAAAAALGTVHRLSLDASLLTDACVEPLAAMTHLEELELSIAAGLRSRESHTVERDLLSVMGAPDDHARLDAIAPALPRLPRLRRMRLFHCIDAHAVMAMLPRTHLQELCVERSFVALADLRQLAGLPSLRALTIDDSACAKATAAEVVVALADLRQLQRLQVLAAQPDDVPLRALRDALPGCEVSVVPQVENAASFTFAISR